jgi:uncharacterized phage protein (TIGR01671 family)
MNRQILFRGKSTRTGEWIEGDLTQDCDFVLSGEFGKEYHRYKTAIIDGGEIDEVHPETVGQFTGLLDKNGVKVFEGDKIHSKYWNPSVYKVIFEDGEFCFVSLDGIEEPYTNSISYVFDFEIIGNIHEETQS